MTRRVVIVCASAAALLTGCETVRTATGELERVGLHVPVWQMAEVGWTPAEPAAAQGEPRVNRSVAGTPLRVAGLDFQQGIGVGGDALFVFTPGGRSTRLELAAGVDDASPDSTGQAHVEIRSDGTVVWSARLRRGNSPQTCDISIPAAQHVLIRITAPTGVFTDILMPRMTGTPGLRAALQAGRQAYEDALFAVPERLARAHRLATGAVLFPCTYGPFGACLGLSNAHMCVIAAPQRGGAIVHCGPDAQHNLLAEPSVLELHPRERLISARSIASSGVWKWRVEADGTLRMLSPVDPVHGVRWTRTLALVPGMPAMRCTILMKNALGHAISWSTGTRLAGASESNVVLPPNPRAAGWAMLHDDAYALLVAPEEPRHGLYPYDGLRISSAGASAVTLSELTPLAPQEFGGCEQFWVIGSWRINQQETMLQLEDVRDAARAAWRTWLAPPGRPTGRTQAAADAEWR